MVRPVGIEPTTSWFVAMHSIQLSYGRPAVKFAFPNYSGNRFVSTNLIAWHARLKHYQSRLLAYPRRNQLQLHALQNRGLAKVSREKRKSLFVNLSKSFFRRAKATRPCVLSMHVGNALEMASDMLLLVADEVARNGAFGKILRPEVFPNAPLQFPQYRSTPPSVSPPPQCSTSHNILQASAS
jgi:hypothetical protein